MEEKKRRSWIVDVIIIIVIIGLAYLLYTVIGGELTMSDLAGDDLGPFEGIMQGVRGIGNGISNMFSGMMP